MEQRAAEYLGAARDGLPDARVPVGTLAEAGGAVAAAGEAARSKGKRAK